MKKRTVKHNLMLAMAAALAVFGGAASAAALDMSVVTGAVDGATVVTAIGSVAAILVLPRAAGWAYKRLIGFIPK